jgi:hypothetical protein
MKRFGLFAAAGLLMMLPSIASAGPRFFFGFGFPIPVPAFYAAPVVTYVAPAPVVYTAPAPVVVAPAPVVVAPASVVVAPAPVVAYYNYGPRYYYRGYCAPVYYRGSYCYYGRPYYWRR